MLYLYVVTVNSICVMLFINQHEYVKLDQTFVSAWCCITEWWYTGECYTRNSSNHDSAMNTCYRRFSCRRGISCMLWLPYCFTAFVGCYTAVAPLAIKLTTWFGLFNSCINSYVFIWVNKHYRHALKNTVPLKYFINVKFRKFEKSNENEKWNFQ